MAPGEPGGALIRREVGPDCRGGSLSNEHLERQGGERTGRDDEQPFAPQQAFERAEQGGVKIVRLGEVEG